MFGNKTFESDITEICKRCSLRSRYVRSDAAVFVRHVAGHFGSDTGIALAVIDPWQPQGRQKNPAQDDTTGGQNDGAPQYGRLAGKAPVNKSEPGSGDA